MGETYKPTQAEQRMPELEKKQTVLQHKYGRASACLTATLHAACAQTGMRVVLCPSTCDRLENEKHHNRAVVEIDLTPRLVLLAIG